MTLLFADERIQIQTDGAGRPVGFRRQGKKHLFLQVVQHWEIDTDWWTEEGRVWRDNYAAVTMDGLLCVVYQDLVTQEWFLQKYYD